MRRGPHFLKMLSYIAPASTALSILLSLIVLAEWTTNSLRIARISPEFVPMAPSTALCFVLLGPVLICRQWRPINRIVERVLHVPAGIVLVFNAVILVQFVLVSATGLSLDIEQWIVSASLTEQDLIHGKDGDPLYSLAIIENITERKLAEQERERLLEKLEIGKEQLQTPSHRLVEVQEIERRNLVRNLHDEVGQNMTALSINMNIIHSQLPADSSDKLSSRLDDSMKLIEETVERIRDLMAELRPPVLDDYGLMAALNWYGNQFSERTEIATIVEGEELKPRLPLATETVLFRITQEALTNVMKHAQAKQVIISLKSDGEKLYLTIADDGVGFDQQEQQQPQWGLINMRERAQAVGGTLTIESAKGEGTKVIGEIQRNS